MKKQLNLGKCTCLERRRNAEDQTRMVGSRVLDSLIILRRIDIGDCPADISPKGARSTNREMTNDMLKLREYTTAEQRVSRRMYFSTAILLHVLAAVRVMDRPLVGVKYLGKGLPGTGQWRWNIAPIARLANNESHYD